MKRYFLPLFILFSFSLFAQKAELSSTDIRPLMDKLFMYHIDRKELTTDIVKRSFKIYLTQFDPTHSYLLLDETKSYLHPTDHFISSVLKDYEKDRYVAYFTLDRTIKGSVQRARGWRQEWEADPVRLVFEAKKIKKSSIALGSIPTSKRDLKQRHYQRFLLLIAFQMEEQKQSSYDGLEEKLVMLCERQLTSMENSYLGIDQAGNPLSESEQEHQIVLRTIKSLAYSLDAHTAYFSAEEAHAMKVQLEKGMCGIGVVLREGIDGILIHDMLGGGPAKESGEIAVGDTITEVDGKSVKGASFRHVLDIMRGKEGTVTTLGLVRREKSGESKFRQVKLTRRRIALDGKRVDVSSEPHGDGVIGKITLHSFYEGEGKLSSEEDLKKAISELREEGPLHGLVLDMRDNCGGFLSQAIKVCGLFISNGVVVISKYSDGTIKYYRTLNGESYFDGPLIVLVSKGSASAAEIVAQTLQDYGVAIVVGDEQTYGKGTIQHQTVTDKDANSYFKVTVGRYYTTSGKSTQVDGVQSDIVVPTEMHYTEIGERYLEFPLPSDRVSPAFEDPLTDVDPFAKRWFEKHYTPTLQQRQTVWNDHLPILQSNSKKRITRNKNYQQFLIEIKEKVKLHGTHGQNDLQLDESVNILKDMIYLNSTCD
ncbi:MAG: hypothetical protein S4CHLAM45_04470 [Chlamydiales bacterium]|nr:hypothetical protein [Chlamydiales bacterium]MCH9619299.1 hypothetical protein [Chlamydiales bacterium]MCH9622561.1 hypothetical protein [Chlamydiales bacterium]